MGLRRRHGRVNRWVLVGVALLALALYWVETRTARQVRSRGFEVKLAAARVARAALAEVKALRDSLGLPIDSINDPNATGLVGLQFSPVTHSRSDLSDALTTANPNFAAAVVEMLLEAGARPGDTIGISWDGTWPALNIAVLAAAGAMRLQPVVVTTLSAGMWGANQPGMLWPDIEQMLVRSGVTEVRTTLAFVGGDDDDGRGLSPEGRDLLTDAAAQAGMSVVTPESLAAGTAARLQALGRVKAAVCVGRAAVHLGDRQSPAPSRVLRGRADARLAGGLVRALLERGTAVVHIANPRRVAAAWRLPIAPVPLPEPGRGRLFYERRFSTWLAGLLAAALLAVLWFVVRYDVESYLGVKRSRDEEVSV